MTVASARLGCPMQVSVRKVPSAPFPHYIQGCAYKCGIPGCNNQKLTTNMPGLLPFQCPLPSPRIIYIFLHDTVFTMGKFEPVSSREWQQPRGNDRRFFVSVSSPWQTSHRKHHQVSPHYVNSRRFTSEAFHERGSP